LAIGWFKILDRVSEYMLVWSRGYGLAAKDIDIGMVSV
jgi:hypothetical protein